MPKIKNITAREIVDSRGNPTIAAKVLLSDGTIGQAMVPSGASTGVHEALELRDGNIKRYHGKGVLKAVANVNKKIAPKLKGFEVTKQSGLDQLMLELDGTPNKNKLGANAILAVSLACAQAAANSKKISLFKYLRQLSGLKETAWKLPKPMMNVLNGGAHANWAADWQEFMLVPQQATFAERVRCGSEIFQTLKKILKAKKLNTAVGDEGGFAPQLKTAEDSLDLLMTAIKETGYRAGREVAIAIDLASSEFFNSQTNQYELKNAGRKLSGEEFIKYLEQLVAKYPIISLEDPLAEDDWSTWQKLTKVLGKKVHLVGDDLFTTDPKRLQQGIDNQVANAILIKVNQIGSLTETLTAIRLAKKHGYKVIISHRSGETEDTFIADLAVAVNADYLKAGSLSRSERVAKYNRVMEIEGELKK
ncbi:MAG: phosphopyruvate hydratase [Candidatus Buchananbacteria bacterium]